MYLFESVFLIEQASIIISTKSKIDRKILKKNTWYPPKAPNNLISQNISKFERYSISDWPNRMVKQIRHCVTQ